MTPTISITANNTAGIHEGQTITIQGMACQVVSVKPTRVKTDEYGIPCDFPGVEIEAVSLTPHPMREHY